MPSPSTPPSRSSRVLLVQHAGKLTAMPPSDVSLYFVFISSPVCRIASMQLSSGMTWVPSPCGARLAAETTLMAPIALRSMQGIGTRSPFAEFSSSGGLGLGEKFEPTDRLCHTLLRLGTTAGLVIRVAHLSRDGRCHREADLVSRVSARHRPAKIEILQRTILMT